MSRSVLRKPIQGLAQYEAVKGQKSQALFLAKRLISSWPASISASSSGGSMKMKMSPARVAMAHDWKIAEAAWLHLPRPQTDKKGEALGSDRRVPSQSRCSFSHFTVVSRPRVAHAL